MNILYVSHLSTNIAAGPNWSVPARVDAQSKYDNVMLLNTTNVMMEHWKTVDAFHNLSEFGDLHLNNLPVPFIHPDLVVFEGFNFIEHVSFAKELMKDRIPYIITPRGGLTYEAQHNHSWLKKMVARWLFLGRFIKKAKAIQYLTKGECESSLRMFKTPYFIIPNGFVEPKVSKTAFSQDGIRAVFIGRLDMFHKGIDILLEAISQISDELLQNRFVLDIYGPRRYDYYQIAEVIDANHIEKVVRLHDEISGKEKERVLLASDLFVMTSRLEGLPMGLLEALSYGLPCLASRGTNMFEEIKNYNAGWICETNTNSVLKALLEVLKSRAQLRSKGMNALVLSKEYHWDKIAYRFHKEVEHLISIY